MRGSRTTGAAGGPAPRDSLLPRLAAGEVDRRDRARDRGGGAAAGRAAVRGRAGRAPAGAAPAPLRAQCSEPGRGRAPGRAPRASGALLRAREAAVLAARDGGEGAARAGRQGRVWQTAPGLAASRRDGAGAASGLPVGAVLWCPGASLPFASAASGRRIRVAGRFRLAARVSPAAER